VTVRTPLSEPGYYHTGRQGSAAKPREAHQDVSEAKHAENLTLLGWADLRKLAKALDVTDYSKMKRPALEAAIRSAQRAANAVD
jgi:hypothetical protein